MIKISGKFIGLVGLLFVSLLAYLVTYQVIGLRKSHSNLSSQQNLNYPTGERTIQVYTGNVVSPNVSQEPLTETKKQPGRLYPLTDGKTYKILGARKYECEKQYWSDSLSVEILQVNIGEKWEEVFRTKDVGNGHCSDALVIGEDEVEVSPLQDYVKFKLYGWEWADEQLVNIKTKRNVLKSYTHPRKIEWSKDGQNYGFISYQEQMGGSGEHAVLVSEYKNPEKPKLVFNLATWTKVPSDQMYWQLYGLSKLQFTDEKTIEFGVFKLDENGEPGTEELARYEYDLEKGKLTEIFRK